MSAVLVPALVTAAGVALRAVLLYAGEAAAARGARARRATAVPGAAQAPRHRARPAQAPPVLLLDEPTAEALLAALPRALPGTSLVIALQERDVDLLDRAPTAVVRLGHTADGSPWARSAHGLSRNAGRTAAVRVR
ncbi:hypothetical protein B7755_047135 [Streptomyces sp. NBS 14/10]|uniref:hypothetical protein n=1 Tax=Streptomyces sp. NBS 14/10 TaxID=1945643 RepID=UPI00211B22CB|nr:hypothetical protein [Streptomyces sp. NBS 14/10]KAK1185008.1 hypothetical protein B7755_047135 [Streptomyces sp. NBS 14/10]